MRIHDSRQVQEDERELEGPPTRTLATELVGQALAQRTRNGPVRHAEGIERVFIHHESRNAAFHSIRSMPGATEQFVGSVPPLLVEIGHVSTLQANPPSVLIDERTQGRFCRCSIREIAEDLHRKLRIADIHRPRAFHRRIRNPSGTQHLALAVHKFPVRRNAVSGGVLRCVGVVQIRDLIVPCRRPSTTRVRSRNDGSFGAHLDLRLEGICRIRIRLLWFPLIDQKDGHGSRAGRNVHETLGFDCANGHVEPQTAGFGNRAVSCVYYTHRDSSFLRRTLPDLHGASVGTLDLGAAIVTPAQGHGHIGRVFVDEETQSDRWERKSLSVGGSVRTNRNTSSGSTISPAASGGHPGGSGSRNGTDLEGVRHSNTRIVHRKVPCIPRYEKAIHHLGTRPDDCVGQADSMLAPDGHCNLADRVVDGDALEVGEKRLQSGHLLVVPGTDEHLHPCDRADCGSGVPCEFAASRFNACQVVDEDVGIDQGTHQAHSCRSARS